MRRREFIAGLGGTAAAWSLAARAQQPSTRRIGVLMAFAESDPQAQARVAAFQKGLGELGWFEGRNIHIDTRWAPDAERTRLLARELVALKPDVIVAHTTPAARAVQQETRAIPLVFVGVADPVGAGFAASLPWPGGNITGFTNIEPTMAGKWVELLKEVAPRVSRAAILFNPQTAPYTELFLKPFEFRRGVLAVEAIVAPVGSASALESALTAQASAPQGGLVVMPDVFTTAHRGQLIAWAAHHRVPAVYPFRYFAELGGLLSYGNDTLDMVRRVATYADRILKGATPSELPVQAPVKFELVINLKTAKALDLDVPLHLQQRADEVIE